VYQMKKTTWLDFGLLAALVAAVAFFNYVWITTETRPPHWDMGRHLWTSLIYLDNLYHFRHIYRLWTDYYFYPPFRHWVTIPFYLVFGKTLAVAVGSNLFFVAVLAFSMYGIGRELWNRTTGLLAALFILASPYYVSQFKEYMMDAPLGSMVALSLFLLLKTENFSNKGNSRWLGFSMGLGMLTKWNFAPCMVVPLIYVLVQGWKKDPSGKNGERSNILWALVIASGVSLLWYANHPRMLREDLVISSLETGKPPFFNWDAQWFYFWVLEKNQLFLVPFLMFLGGLFWSAFSRRVWDKNKILVLFVLGNYFLFNLIHRDLRYTMPMMVGVSALAVFWIGEIGAAWARTMAVVLTVAYCAFAFWAVSFGTALIPQQWTLGPLVLFSQQGCMLGAPSRENWHQDEAVKFVAGEPAGDREMTFKGMDTLYFNYWGLYYFSRLYGVNFKPFDDQAAYLLWREKTAPPVPKGYLLIKRFDLPDSSVLELFKRHGIPTK